MDKQQNSESDMVFAGFLERLAARFIDAIVCLFIVFILTIPVGVAIFMMSSNSNSDPIPLTILLFLIPFFAIHGYFIVLNALFGQTLGKKLAKIKIVKTNNENLGFVTAIIREIAEVVSVLPFFIGYFWILIDKKKQGWHDKIAKTYVVKIKD